jgi:hypothetical protein
MMPFSRYSWSVSDEKKRKEKEKRWAYQGATDGVWKLAAQHGKFLFSNAFELFGGSHGTLGEHVDEGDQVVRSLGLFSMEFLLKTGKD